jgi:hypothetical protein
MLKLDYRYSIWQVTVLAAVLLVGCTPSYTLQPDHQRFERIVGSPALRDSLRQGKLVPGMPYFVAAKIFSQWSGRRKTPVPSLGSRQELQEFEGWHRQFMDPKIRVFVDEYKTDSGTLCLWYQYPDFYRMGVSVKDTLVVFAQGQKFSSVVQCIRSSETLTVKDELSDLSDEDTLYAEIHYVENPDRPSNVSYWYLLKILSDDKTFVLRAPSFEYYPIEWIELNDTPVTSFNWRKLP